MTRLIAPQHRAQFFLASLLIVVLAYMFWTGSRYPALDEKAMMSGALQLEDNLSFEALVPITPDMGLIERVFWSTLNWLNTNKKGMTFGILFAASFLTAAAYLKQRSFRGGFANATLGLVIGTPLGVCVNCAAPIAQGMYASGLRAETTLAAMIASPTLNIVVLTMLFSLLPFYMVAAKIALSLTVILIMVPLICRLLPARELAMVDAPEGACAFVPERPDAPAQPLHVALWEVARGFVQNLIYILRLTLPLMLLAGFLGALVATLLPQDLILGLPFSVWVLILIALVGVFLPVPIAFDVVVTGALLGLGLSHGYVMALLFTLGTFSIYSFFIVYQSVGPRAAWLLMGTVAAFGVLAGAAAEGWHRYQSNRALELLLQPQAQATPWGAAWADGTPGSTIKVTSTPLAAPSPVSETDFIRREASAVGIDKPVEFSFRDMWPPFWEGRSLSAGDIDRDGDNDLVIASTEKGLYF
ncbi:MAG: permease, partial [Pseudomonadota bacterium]